MVGVRHGYVLSGCHRPIVVTVTAVGEPVSEWRLLWHDDPYADPAADRPTVTLGNLCQLEQLPEGAAAGGFAAVLAYARRLAGTPPGPRQPAGIAVDRLTERFLTRAAIDLSDHLGGVGSPAPRPRVSAASGSCLAGP
ncbi:hypothetical protein ASF62_08935 [Leifsonia sp. Leaf325]|nr:hypothetical protein ASF62_08935 [Leifsonia sp. Leaf325]